MPGIYPRDKLPIVNKYPSGLFANTDPYDKAGMHWVSFVFFCLTLHHGNKSQWRSHWLWCRSKLWKDKRGLLDMLSILNLRWSEEKESNISTRQSDVVVKSRNAFTDLSIYESRGYWLWHDLLDILDLLVPYEQDWIDYPQQERERIERVILHPNEFCKTCWYWLDLLIIGTDEVDRF